MNMNPRTTNYLDTIQKLVRDSVGSISLQRIIEKLIASIPTNSLSDAKATARATIRDSRLIVSAGADRFEWLPRALRGVTVRHRLTSEEFDSGRLHWAADLLVCLWPAHQGEGVFQNIDPIHWCIENGPRFSLSLVLEDGEAFGQAESGFWSWLSESGLKPQDDLIVTATEPSQGTFSVRPELCSHRNESTIAFRDRIAKASIENFLKTQRDGLAEPIRIAADILASSTYQIKVPPSPLCDLLPTSILEAYAKRKAPPPTPKPLPTPVAIIKKVIERKIVSAQPPYNRGWELPDEASFTRCMAEVDEKGVRDLEAALELLKTTPLCAPAYAILSQSDHYQDRSLELAGQAVIATERRIAHSVIESLINGNEVVLEDLVEMYLESRGFLARTMWSARQQDEGLEQALHCYEVAPHNAEVREDLFIMLFDTARWDFILRLLDTNLGLPLSEEVYHRALVLSLTDPASKEASGAVRKAVSANPYLARLLLGENPSLESKKSQISEAECYEASYGYLWRRDQDVFNLLESITVEPKSERS